ncbi:MAG: acyl transferase [Bacteroidetes bacterium]|nr:acyl transferase [Bacteroidota bacterium]
MQSIFNIQSQEDFRQQCIATFHYQYQHVEIYQKFVDYLQIDPLFVYHLEDIPFLPIEMFKKHKILSSEVQSENYFQSSGTTEITNKSRHFLSDFNLYEESISKSFTQFIGDPKEFIFLGLLPNYSENPHSSLIYMVDFLMKKSNKIENGYFLYNHSELYNLLKRLNIENKKIILFGVSFALLDFIDFCKENQLSSQFPNLTILETGGMKGRKKEMTKDELLNILKNEFGTEKIFSEYSMTELLSQAYSLGENQYLCPNWMRILIRNLDDPFSYVQNGKSGAINIIDLANRFSCSFIATQDLGKIENGKFQVLGRVDYSDIRGCSLLVS